MTPSRTAFTELLSQIERVDERLARNTRELEERWSTKESDDAALTELVANLLRRAVSEGLFTLPTMVEGFNTFAHDFHERQIEFMTSGSYRARDYEEVRRAIYDNDDYMRTVYYPALLCSYLASPNYRQLLRSFDATLLRWRNEGRKTLIEVAAGHAFLSLFALNRLPHAEAIGTDISPTAGTFAQALHRISGWGPDRFRIVIADFLDSSDAMLAGPFDAAICCELLEHVPAPERFIKGIHDRLCKGGRLFISAAVRMESVDHLTLFDTTESVTRLLEDGGFKIVEEMSVPFVKSRPRDDSHWARLLKDPHVPATYMAECEKRS